MTTLIFVFTICIVIKKPLNAYVLKKLYPNMSLKDLIKYEKETKSNLFINLLSNQLKRDNKN